MDGNDISPPRPVALCHFWRNRSARLVFPHLYARNTLSEAMGTETVSHEKPQIRLRPTHDFTVSSESSSWFRFTPQCPSFPSTTTDMPSTLKYSVTATRLSQSPPSSPLSVTMLRTICTSRKTISERSVPELGFGRFLGSRNAGAGGTERGGRREVALHGSMFVDSVNSKNIHLTDTSR
jgi:hypothetical protein